MDMVLYYTMTTVITCTSDTRIYYTDYYYTYGFHWYMDIPIHVVPYCYHRYMDTRYTVISCSHITVTSRVYMHVLFLFSCHMDPRAYYMYYCSILSPYSCYMIVSHYWYCYSHYWTWAVDMRCVESHIFCSCFPLSCSILSTELRSCYLVHVSCTIFVLVTLCTWNIRS